MNCYRIAHLSDLHFASWDGNISQLFSKRWLGNLNFLFGRRHQFDHERLLHLPGLLKSLDTTTVIITGDLSTTSAPAEFQKAREYVNLLEKEGLEVLCIPGNHDHYTKGAYRNRRFYDYFASSWDPTIPYSLKVKGVTAKKLGPGWWLIGLDTALATSWFYSTGYFDPKIEEALSDLLKTIPSQDQIILFNHFPFFMHETPRKQLVRGDRLQQLIAEHPQIKLYCHGHTHRRCQADLRSSRLPLIFDTGSTSYRKQGGWNLMDLSVNSISVESYEWSCDAWQPQLKVSYELV